MLADVGQRLLRGAVGDERHAARQLHLLVAGAKEAGDAGALLEAAGHPLQRGDEALLEDGRAQVVHHALARLDGVAHRLERRLRAQRDAVRIGVAHDPGEVVLQRGERAADVVVHLARDRRALGLDAGLQVLRELREAPLRFGQRLVGGEPRALGLAGLDRVQHRRHEPREVALQQVVAGAVPHRGDGGVLADLARDDDERDDAAARLQHLERGEAGEAGQVEVGQDHVPVAAERLLEFGGGLDAQGVGLDAAAAQLRHGQHVVEFRILDEQHAQGALGRALGGHGSSIAARRAAPGNDGQCARCFVCTLTPVSAAPAEMKDRAGRTAACRAATGAPTAASKFPL